MLLEELKISESELREIKLVANIFTNSDVAKLALLHEKELISNKIRILPYIPLVPQKVSFNEIHRISINRSVRDDKQNGRLHKIQDLKYPPLEKAKKLNYNRCNFKGQQMFYGGFGLFSTLFETQPIVGDLITFSKWKLKINEKLCFIPLFQKKDILQNNKAYEQFWKEFQNKIEKLDNITRVAIEQTYDLISFFFYRNVNQSIEYLYSAYFANQFFSLPYEEKIEAILYPGVRNEYLSSNIAILPEIFEEKIEFIEAQEHIVVIDPNYSGGWISEEIAITNELIDNKLIWKTTMSERFIKEYKNKFDLIFE